MFPLPYLMSSCAVEHDTWILDLTPLLSMRAAVFTVSLMNDNRIGLVLFFPNRARQTNNAQPAKSTHPNSWNLDLSPGMIPAVTAPLCNPTRKARFRVSGPRKAARETVKTLHLCMQSLANLAMRRA